MSLNYTQGDVWLTHAVNEIESTYGDRVSIELKEKSLIKFGRNEDVGTTEETVWLVGGDETYPTTNAIDTIVSTDAGDDQQVIIEGHTISGNDLTFVTQTATLNGTTNVSLISKDDYWIITGISVGVKRTQTRSVDFKFQRRPIGKTFTTKAVLSSANVAGTVYVPFTPHLIVPKNNDVRMRATSSGTTTQVEATMFGILASII